jgi:hypothetical protein
MAETWQGAGGGSRKAEVSGVIGMMEVKACGAGGRPSETKAAISLAECSVLV